ncbi:site-specific integrase [Streptococcus suis]|uniref:Site-specific integrase n=3 Tax=Streptococcus suis TaxID=1307 RepID=A0A9X4MMI1_STRSU|nr:site-specific integrase [Streptococcus suis]MDG4516431.1 site-specific integrase [Streptococcus suis]MDG4520589.1 site-specific integrase [Streptococcus suis]MDG4522592.1 site-specific integrase [Streptococcus suis]HEM6121522.1 site-specific integrase [Streptococcus suis]HEM6237757.1 site-specific integrase [Streptococcus suis]
MPRKRNSLKHDIFVAATKDVTNNTSRTSYKRSATRFVKWAKVNGIKKISDITEEVLQAYHDDLKNDPKGYTAATIHTYLAPICKAAGINLNRIRKQKRTSDKIIRGRQQEANAQGKRQELNSLFSRLIDFQKVVGIRRNELKNLTGSDLKQDEFGNCYVLVKRGKGGKKQMQYILPKDIELVRRTFAGIEDNKPVFTKEEMNNQINLHALRAQHARDSYFFYLEKIQENPQLRQALSNLLIKKWEEGHQKFKNESTRQYERQRRNFIYDLRDEAYVLRGSNKSKALASGMPIVYNRLALMAVSVLNLSHWRLSVTVTNYIL